MPATEAELMDRLDALGIETDTMRHAPMFTVEDGLHLHGEIPGGHCKSLFLKDKKGGLWLVSALHDTGINLKALQAIIGAARLSFGRPDLLEKVLGVTPGTVTPFALINAEPGSLSVILDQRMMEMTPIHFHPLTNAATTAIKPNDLLRFISDCGFTAKVTPLPG